MEAVNVFIADILFCQKRVFRVLKQLTIEAINYYYYLLITIY